MRRLILSCGLSPGDIVVMTAAVRDLHLSYRGQFETDVRTPCPAIWENNPYITPVGSGEFVRCDYDLVHQSNQLPYHFIHGFRLDLNEKLGLDIRPFGHAGEIHLSAAERAATSPIPTPYWIIVAGGKKDFTTKIWEHSRFQEVVDHFDGRIQFVQAGAVEPGHAHVPLNGVIDMVGKTNLRQAINLIYHAEGVICGVTFFMHAAAAIPSKTGSRACVVIAGGRESNIWEGYRGHRFIDTIGGLPCCRHGGCWKDRVVKLNDGEDKGKSFCDRPIKMETGDYLPKCMDMILPIDVIRQLRDTTVSVRP
jgi:hypothetical protein